MSQPTNESARLGAGPPRPFVTIAMPALDEERYIERAVLSIVPEAGTVDYELLVLDGGSADATPRIVRDLAARNPRIRLVPNEGRLQSAAVNKAATIGDPRAAFLVRADCHADYPPNFVAHCVAELVARDAASVVVPMRTTGTTCFQKAVAAAQNSRLGNGGSAHRRAAAARYVDHGHHAAFRRSAFVAAGGYDEGFTHNEDAELDVRLGRAGGRIWLAADMPVRYFPRSSVSALARQYYNHGRGRASTLLKHRLRPKLRQLLPPTAILLGLLGLLLSVVDWRFLIVPSLYVSGALLAGSLLAVRTATPCAVASGLAALVMHAAWAAGFMGRIARQWLPRPGRARRPAPRPGAWTLHERME